VTFENYKNRHMKHLKNSLIIFGLLLLNFSTIEAQKVKHKFGKLNPGEAEMKFYEPDSSASAVILFDKGYSYFEYDNQLKDFKIIFKRTLRIKIFKKDAYSYADFEIPLYIGNHGAEEAVTSLKGKTFNLENGKVVETKINKSNIFYDNKSKHRKIAKASFPNVKEGSVIDLEYKISSDFIFNLRGWQFQYEIPVKYSEYSTLVPEYFKYNKNQKGYENIILNEKDEYRNETFSVEYRTGPGQGGRIERGTIEYASNSSLTTWTVSDIPAFVEEPYITTAENYMTALEFELKTISYPRQTVSYYTTSWNDVNKKLSQSSYFGKQLIPTPKIKLATEKICKDAETKLNKLKAIYLYITKNIKWNGYNSKYIKDKLNVVLDKKTGNSADINMLLINMLKSGNIVANPVVLSTRNNGIIFPTHPSLSSFNYVIAEVTIDGKKYFIDATEEDLPMGMLPERCLNGTGRIVGTPNFDEVSIVPSQRYKESYLYTVTINPNENLTGKVTETYKEYAAYDIRDNIIQSGSEEEYITNFIDNTSDAEISDVEIKNTDDIYKPLIKSYQFETVDNVIFAGNMIYLTPLLNEKRTNNPFKSDNRKYPVDYSYPYYEKVIFQYTLPEGYEITEKPENTVFSLPGRTAQFQYQVSSVGNMFQVISIFRINKPVFQYDSYKALKKFYDMVIKKQNEKIVLKKI